MSDSKDDHRYIFSPSRCFTLCLRVIPAGPSLVVFSVFWPQVVV